MLMLGGMALITFLIRYVLLGLAGRFTMPALMERALNYVPPAVLTAIFLPELLQPGGAWNLHWNNAYLIGGLAALGGGLLFKRSSLMASIVLGLAVFYLWRFLF